ASDVNTSSFSFCTSSLLVLRKSDSYSRYSSWLYRILQSPSIQTAPKMMRSISIDTKVSKVANNCSSAAKLFDKKLSVNSSMCPVSIALTHIAPFIIIVKDKDYYGFENYYFNGIEWEIINDLKRRLRFKLIISDLSKKGEIINPNRSNTDIFIGRLPYIINENITSTTTYLTSNLVVILPKGRQYTSLERILYPFDLQTWIYICVSMISGIFVILYLLTRNKNNLLRMLILGKQKSHVLNIFSVMASNPVKNPELTFPKFLLMCWIILAFILRVAYQANLYELLKSNRSKPIPKSLSEVFQSQYILYCTEAVGKMMEKIPELKKSLFIISPGLNYNQSVSDMKMLNWMTRKTFEDKIGIIVTEESFYNFKMENQRRSHGMVMNLNSLDQGITKYY
uniref:Ionotropic glutamate receptor C-terminal domain-containing protein n=1 Tax=Megaselia scalaris TaxID=36166 RepID=T1GAZ1_MEGSC